MKGGNKRHPVYQDVGNMLNRRIKNLEDHPKIQAAFERGTYKAAKFLLEKSLEIVPVDTGRLYRSGTVNKNRTGQGRRTVATVKYKAPYAIYVHEDLTARHKPGKTAKYLERPARIYRSEMRAIIEKEVNAAIRQVNGAARSRGRRR